MDRRGFLKILGAVAVSSSMPAIALAFPDEQVDGYSKELGRIRELVGYDIRTDSYIIRLDAMNKVAGHQIYAMERIVTPASDEYKKARMRLAKTLNDKMNRLGWKYSDLSELPIPAGIERPDWAC